MRAYPDQYVAVFEKRILGSGKDVLRLRRTLAAKHNLDQDRIVISYIEGPGHHGPLGLGL